MQNQVTDKQIAAVLAILIDELVDQQRNYARYHFSKLPRHLLALSVLNPRDESGSYVGFDARAKDIGFGVFHAFSDPTQEVIFEAIAAYHHKAKYKKRSSPTLPGLYEWVKHDSRTTWNWDRISYRQELWEKTTWYRDSSRSRKAA